MDVEFICEKLQVYSRDLAAIGLSQYVVDCLYGCGYRTVGKIVEMTIQDILQIRGIEEKHCLEIVERVAELGIEIRDLQAETSPRTYDLPHKSPYPHNLIAAVKNIAPSELNQEFYGRDRMMGIAVALSTLTEQEETMVLLRYKHSATLERIGDYYDLTGERARQIIKKALRKMGHPSRSILLEKGLEGYIERIVNSRVESRIKSMLYDEYMRGYEGGIEDAMSDHHISKIEKVMDLSIEEMDLSVRAYNCLKRIGVNKVRDILAYDTEDEIMKIRNLGKRCTEEVAARLNHYGVCNEAWSHFLIIDE